MTDTIDRSEAVRLASSLCYTSDIVKGLRELPSAQPEIIRCRDCRKYLRLGCPMGITVFDAPDPDGFCYKSERRTDEQTDRR